MTLRPARRRRYALSQYATVKGFLFGSKNGLVSFFLGAVGVRLTLQSADALAVGCIIC